MKNRFYNNDNWATPKDLLEKIRSEFGDYFDPCPLNATFDGLNIDWKPINYINPPYSRKLKELFIKKAYQEGKKGKICIMLLPVSTSTKIFHEIILPNAEIRFLKGRVKFIGHNTKNELVTTKTGQHDSMIVIFPKNRNIY